MKKIKALLAVLCIVFVACAVMACNFKDSESAKTVVNAPVINSKVYNGEKQAATVEASDAYTVIENNGGVNAGEYNVVLKLTDENAYEWKTPDEADTTMLTLKFVIIKATNSVSELTLNGWRAGETANVPAANAEFGEVKFAYATEQNGTYTENVPTAAGIYFVKAYVEATENYDGAEAVISFEITKAKNENAVTVSAEDVKYGENVTPVVTANATHIPDGAEIVYTYALTSDGEYVAWEAIEKRAGAYFVKATVAEDDDYKGASAIAGFEMTKGDNAINDFEIDAVTCKQNIVLNATATAGTVVTYKYATAADGEYIDIPADGLVAGTYYVKAYTAGNNNYAAAESNPAMLTVNHAYTWTTDANGNDYRACTCGSTERFVFDTSAEVLEKTESGYSLKLYTAEDEGKPNKVTFSFKVTLGTTVTENAVMAWTQSTEGIVEIAGSAEYTVKALAIGETVLTATYTTADGKKAHVTINVTVERLTKNVEVAHETILADLATTELDLSFASAYFTENASLAYGDKVLGNGALNGGKLTVDFSEMTDAGNLTFVATTDKDGVYYSFNVNVLLATKIIRTVNDLDVVKVTQTNIDNNTSIYGYYVLGNDINVKWIKPMMTSLTYNDTVKNWEANFGFRGTFDGLGHTISGFAVNTFGMFGHVGKGAVIKNVKFDKFKYNGQYNGGLFGGTVRGAEITDVSLSNVEYVNAGAGIEHTQGFFASRYMQDNKLTNIKIDANKYDVYSVFGYNISNNTYTNVEIKVKSFTMLGYNSDERKDTTIIHELDGVIVYTNETVELEHETILLETTATQIDLSFAIEYIGDTVSLTHNGKVLGDGAVLDGKLNVNLSGITETGALTLLASTVKNNVIYTFNVNVLLATKIIRTVNDLDVVKVTQTNIDNNTSIYGYYVLGNDINVKWIKPMMTSLTYNDTVKNWEANFGFRGTFDGLGHTISGFAVNTFGMFGHVGKGAVIKNVKFDKFKYNGQYNGGLFGGTVRGAEITDVSLSNVEYVNAGAGIEHTQGFFASRYMQDNKLTNIKIDANKYDVYSVFGYNISNNTYTNVEIKVKSFTMFGYNGEVMSDETMLRKLDGVTVITADTTIEA